MRWSITCQNLWTNFLQIMENNNFTAYKFDKYDVEGLKFEINFSNTDFIEIKTHEEINFPIENIEQSFEPLLFGIDMNITNIRNVNDLKGKKIAATKGTDPFLFTLQALDTVGLNKRDVQLVHLQHPDGKTALERGQVVAKAWNPCECVAKTNNIMLCRSFRII